MLHIKNENNNFLILTCNDFFVNLTKTEKLNGPKRFRLSKVLLYLYYLIRILIYNSFCSKCLFKFGFSLLVNRLQ